MTNIKYKKFNKRYKIKDITFNIKYHAKNAQSINLNFLDKSIFNLIK